MKNFALIIVATIFLAGCVHHHKNNQMNHRTCEAGQNCAPTMQSHTPQKGMMQNSPMQR